MDGHSVAEALVQSLSVGACALRVVEPGPDSQAVVVAANPAWSSLVGASPAGLHQAPAEEAVPVAPVRFLNAVRNVATTGSPQVLTVVTNGEAAYVEIRLRRADARLVLCEAADVTQQTVDRRRIDHLVAAQGALRELTRSAFRARTVESLACDVCERLVVARGYLSVWIAVYDAAFQLQTACESGIGPAFDAMRGRLESRSLPACAQAVLEKDGMKVVGSPVCECVDCPLAGTHPEHAAITVQLDLQDAGVAVVSVLTSPELARDQDEQNFMAAVAEDASVALRSLLQEAQRQHTVERYGLVLNAVSDSVYVLDHDWRHVYVNDAGCAFTQKTRDELLGVKLAVAFPGVEETAFYAAFRRVMSSRKPETVVDRFVFPDGHSRWYEVRGYPVHEGILCISHDVTDRVEREERFRLLAEHMPILVNAVNRDGEFVFWNTACERLTGYRREEILGNPDGQALLYPSAEQRRQVHEEWKANGFRFVDKEILLRTKGGEERTVVWSNLPPELGMTDDASWAVGVDITDRRRAEHALYRSRQWLMTTLKSIGDGVIATDTRGCVSLMNPVAERLTGWGFESAQGRSVSEVFRVLNESDRSRVVLPVERVLRENAVVGLANHSVLIARDGTETPIEDSAAPIRDESGETGGVVLIFKDIAQRRWSERRLRESEERFRSLFENSLSGIFYMDTEGNVLEANHRILQMLGSPSAEATKSINVFQFQPLVRVGYAADMQECIRTGGPVFGERRYRSNWGKEMIARYYFNPIRRDGRIVGVLGSVDDVTDYRRAQEQMRAALAEKDVLIRELYHRTKNNMQVIASMLALRRMRVHDQGTRGILKEFEAKIYSMALVHQKLYKSRNLSRIDLSEYLQDLAKLISETYSDGSICVRVVALSEGVSALIDEAVPIGLVVNELVTNAIKYAYPGSGRGEVRIRLQSRGETGLELLVTDDGVGMPDGFDCDSPATLGLLTVGGIVHDQLGGTLELLPGPGTRWRVLLPRSTYQERV